MIYIIAGVGLVVALLLGANYTQGLRVDKFKAEATEARGANASLAADCKTKIDALNKIVKDLGIVSTRKIKASKDAAAKADQTAAAQRDVIDKLVIQAQSAADSADNCKAATATLDQLAKDRRPK